MTQIVNNGKTNKTFNLPPQPELLSALQKEINKTDIDSVKIGNLICSDVAISAAVLKTINSAFFGMKAKVTSIQHAVNLMGIRPTVNVVTSFSLEHSMQNKTTTLPRYWDSAKNAANLCAYIANELKLHEPTQPYTLGLFHDIGIPLMASRFPDYFTTLTTANHQHAGLATDSEDKTYNTNHAVMGYYLCREWGLSESIRNVILQHHDCQPMIESATSPNDKAPVLMSILKLAEWGSEAFRTGETDADWERYGGVILDYLSLSEDDSLDLLEGMKEALLDTQ